MARNRVTWQSLLLFVIVFLFLVNAAYFLQTGKIDFVGTVTQIPVNLFVVLIPTAFTLMGVVSIYVLFKALVWMPDNKSPFKRFEKFFREDLVGLTFHFCYLVVIYLLICAISLTMFLARFEESDPSLAFYLPAIVVGYVFLFRVFSKIGYVKLAEVFRNVFLVTLVLGFAYGLALGGEWHQITLSNWGKQLVVIVIAALDIVLLEVFLPHFKRKI